MSKKDIPIEYCRPYHWLAHDNKNNNFEFIGSGSVHNIHQSRSIRLPLSKKDESMREPAIFVIRLCRLSSGRSLLLLWMLEDREFINATERQQGNALLRCSIRLPDAVLSHSHHLLHGLLPPPTAASQNCISSVRASTKSNTLSEHLTLTVTFLLECYTRTLTSKSTYSLLLIRTIGNFFKAVHSWICMPCVNDLTVDMPLYTKD
jgi:hypothetical protein